MTVKYRNWVTEGINGANLPACAEALISGGKTTAVRTLSDVLELKPLLEDIGAMHQMKIYYRALKGDEQLVWSLMQTQYWLLQRRLSQHKEAFIENSVEFLSDRSLLGDIAFDWTLLKGGRLTNAQFNGIVKRVLEEVDGLVKDNIFYRKVFWLDVSPEVAYDRIHLRGIEHEDEVPLSYLQLLYEGYEKTVLPILDAMGILVRIDWNENKDLVTEEGLNYLKERPQALIDKLKEGPRIWRPQEMPKEIYSKILVPE
jgi:deoxyadenosine/deoxycytidine kinase